MGNSEAAIAMREELKVATNRIFNLCAKAVNADNERRMNPSHFAMYQCSILERVTGSNGDLGLEHADVVLQAIFAHAKDADNPEDDPDLKDRKGSKEQEPDEPVADESKEKAAEK